jgi:hypothetical protein
MSFDKKNFVLSMSTRDLDRVVLILHTCFSFILDKVTRTPQHQGSVVVGPSLIDKAQM